MSRTDRTDGGFDWPAWAERTPSAERERTHEFRVGMGQAIDDNETELENRLGIDDWRLSTAAPHREKDGRPYADANPDDPGAVVRWTKDGEQSAVVADEYAFTLVFGSEDTLRADGANSVRGRAHDVE